MNAKTEQETPTTEEFVKADPALNPRNQALAEIAKGVAERHKVEFAETAPTMDDEGNIQEAAPPAAATEEPAAAPSEEAAPVAEDLGETPPSTPSPPPAQGAHPALDPAAMYDVVIDGQTVKVPGQKIIDAGFRTFQKETAADYRLKLASDLLEEAQARSRAAPPPDASPAAAQQATPSPAADLPFEELARQVQFGTPEQAAEALKTLASRQALDPNQVASIAEQRARFAARDEALFQDAMSFVKTEYADLLSNDYLRRLFFTEENRRRAPKERGGEGDQRPYKELYDAIGKDIRKNLNLQAPARPAAAPATPLAGSAQARAERKAATPPVPRTAAARLAQVEGATKAKTPSEIIAGYAAARGKTGLTQPRKGT